MKNILQSKFYGFLIFLMFFNSCQNTNQNKDQEKEVEILKKEIELLKRENEITKREQELLTNSTDLKTVSSNKQSTTSIDKKKIITKTDIENSFKKYLKEIEGNEGDCDISNDIILVGDINNDGLLDGLVYYACSLKGNIGNASYSGIALFINKGGELQLSNKTIGDLVKGIVIPKKIL